MSRVIQDRAADLLNLDTAGGREPEDLTNPRAVAIANPKPGDTARLQRLEHRVDAKNQHGFGPSYRARTCFDAAGSNRLQPRFLMRSAPNAHPKGFID
jgi:hypothetical protein